MRRDLELTGEDIQPCALCDRGVMHDNSIHFYRITFQSFLANMQAIRQTAGLEMMLGGSPVLADVFSPDSALAKSSEAAQALLICQDCALTSPDYLRLISKLEERAKEECTA